jgi:hypothetical protein
MRVPEVTDLRLLREYEVAAARFSAAATELQARMPIVPSAEYERLKRAAEQARFDSERARLALKPLF